jgi:hypothetical protein
MTSLVMRGFFPFAVLRVRMTSLVMRGFFPFAVLRVRMTDVVEGDECVD